MACRILTALFLTVALAAAVYGCAYSGNSIRTKRQIIQAQKVNTEEPNCDYSAEYRTYDGSCNNMEDGKLGRARSIFQRALPAAYDNNDGQTPRLTSKTGNPLPNPRKVSRIVHDDTGVTHDTTMQVIMAMWGQFLTHDITYTPWNKVEGGCCSDDLVTGNKQHPDVYTGGDCFPIIIDEDDWHWNTTQNRCMEFFRSDSVTVNGVRQQYNQASSFIDGSQVYGLNEDIARNLRTFKDGKLKSVTINGEEFLPNLEQSDESICYKIDDGDYCFATGDDRANLHPGLSAIHTIFLRYHNQVAEKLKEGHPLYDDETLYQEARRIVIAVMQVITYAEYLPKAVGIDAALGYAIMSSRDFPFAYNSSLNPNLMNVFSTASNRFGHSMIPDYLTIDDEAILTGDMFMRPKYVLKKLPGLVQSLIDSPIDRIDRWYTLQMIDRLLERPNTPFSGFDIVARNIQRGRDHGLPNFNDYATRFSTGTKTEWDQWQDRANEKYPDAYEHVDDVDIYSGGVSDVDASRSAGVMVRAIISEQYFYLKWGDRFFYENIDSSVSGGAKLFTSRQVSKLDKVTLARIICDTVPGVKVTKDIFNEITDANNPYVDCSEIEELDISAF